MIDSALQGLSLRILSLRHKLTRSYESIQLLMGDLGSLCAVSLLLAIDNNELCKDPGCIAIASRYLLLYAVFLLVLGRLDDEDEGTTWSRRDLKK